MIRLCLSSDLKRPFHVERIRPLLSDAQLDSIVVFLKALTGDHAYE
jgi:hypothetical protein